MVIAITLVALIAGMLITAVFGNTEEKGPNAKEEMKKYYKYKDREGCYRYKIKLVDCDGR